MDLAENLRQRIAGLKAAEEEIQNQLRALPLWHELSATQAVRRELEALLTQINSTQRPHQNDQKQP